jgi:hypothetical protein
MLFSTLALESWYFSTLALEFSTFQLPRPRFSEQNPRPRLRWNSQPYRHRFGENYYHDAKKPLDQSFIAMLSEPIISIWYLSFQVQKHQMKPEKLNRTA